MISNNYNRVFVLLTAFFILTINSKLFSQSIAFGTEFCSTQTYPCSQSTTGLSTSAGCVDIPIVVSGIGVLNLTDNILNSINVNLGSSACQANIANYDFYLIAPDGTSLKFIDNITGSSTASWVNTTFVDLPYLERIRTEYNSGLQDDYNPWSIGYYAPDVDGSFHSTFNTLNANGTWTFRVCNGTSNTTVISINSICITFGERITYNSVAGNGQALNKTCATAFCIDNTALILGTNDDSGCVSGGSCPGDALFPGDVVSGCNWNNGNHASSWFKFQPTGTTAIITLSGLDGPAVNYNMQPIVLENPSGNGCVTSGADWTVPIGGCPDDESINNTAYLGANGGGMTTAGNIYQSGIGFNTEFNLSGLTPNKIYYLYVDGNASNNQNEFVVSMTTPAAGPTYDVNEPNSAIHCSLPLPVEFLDFIVTEDEDAALVYWSTATESNNHKFVVEKSKDNRNWKMVGEVFGAGNSSSEQAYRLYDENPYNGTSYYRVKQVDYDGKFTYSFVRSFLLENRLIIEPNPNNGEFTLFGLDKHFDNEIYIYNLLGQKVYQETTKKGYLEISLRDVENGIYFISINRDKIIKFIKE